MDNPRADGPQSSDGVRMPPPGPSWEPASPYAPLPSVQPPADEPPWELAEPPPQPPDPWTHPPQTQPPGQRVRRVLVAVLAVIVVVALAGGLMWWMRPPDVPVTPPASTRPATTYPSSEPIVWPEPIVLTSGGQLGQTVDYSTAAGSATIRVVRATWTTQGVAPPPAGYVYLIVDVEFAGRSRAPVAGEGVLLMRDSSGRGQSPAFGTGDQGIPTGVLSPGETLTGQVGFAVRPGEATLSVLDANLLDVVRVAIPGP